MTSAFVEPGELSPGAAAKARSLQELEDAILRDLEILEYPAKPWLTSRQVNGEPVYDVIVVGGGHCGLTAAFALMREKIANILVLDENPAGQEGPWLTYARMPDLRTRKAVTGTELGYPNLTFRSYYEARRGAQAYGELARISCEEWSAYLMWLRRLLRVPYANGCRLDRVTPQPDCFRLQTTTEGASKTLFARRLILATGPLSAGGANIPGVIANSLPRQAYRHVYEHGEPLDLKGKRIAVIGAGASAFDNAGAALEQGAASVRLLARRPRVPRLSLIRWTDWAGLLSAYADLDDARRWRLMGEIQRNPAPPPIRAIRRVEKWPNFQLRFESPILSARWRDGEIAIETPKEQIIVDALLLATGFSVDLRKFAPLASFVDQIALWSDRFDPPDGPGPEKFRNSPYLGRRYQFLEKTAGAAPFLNHIFNFNQSATLSMGPTGRISGLKYGVRRLMLGVCESFLREDFDHHLDSILRYDDSELDGHPWVEERRVK
jgi:FAD-dependent urate hydroxylase